MQEGVEAVVHAGVREARFRVSVLRFMIIRCRLTGYRLTTVTGGSVVDAAHIQEKFAGEPQ